MTSLMKNLILTPINSISQFTDQIKRQSYSEIVSQIIKLQIVLLIMMLIVGIKVIIFLSIGNLLYLTVVMVLRGDYTLSNNISTFKNGIRDTFEGTIEGTEYNHGNYSNQPQPTKIDPKSINPNTRFEDINKPFAHSEEINNNQQQQQYAPTTNPTPVTSNIPNRRRNEQSNNININSNNIANQFENITTPSNMTAQDYGLDDDLDANAFDTVDSLVQQTQDIPTALSDIQQSNDSIQIDNVPEIDLEGLDLLSLDLDDLEI